MTHRLEGKASRPRRNLREKLSSALALKKEEFYAELRDEDG